MMPTSSRSTIGVAVLALLALVDISWVVEAWLGLLDSPDVPPTPALVMFVIVGAVTLGTAQPALRGHRTAAWIMVGSRVVSVLLIDLPTFAFDAPAWVRAITSVAIVLTALGIWWTARLLRGTDAVRTGNRTVA